MKIHTPCSDWSQALPGNMSNLVNGLNAHFQVNQALVIPSLLGMASCLVHDKFKVEIRDLNTRASFFEPLSLFCLGIADSSERKSPLLKWLKQPIEEEVSRKNTQLESKRLQQQCERQVAKDEVRKIRKKISSLPAESPMRKVKMDRLIELEEKLQQPEILPLRLFLQDTTAIAAADFMQTQRGNGLMIADGEGGSFDALLSDHRLQELFISGFSNENISFERSTRTSVEIASPHAGMCILTQEDKLHRLAKKSSTWTEGFIPRTLIFLSPSMGGMRSAGIGTAVSSSLQEWWKGRCQFFLDLPYKEDLSGKRDYYSLHLSDEAASVWLSFSSELEQMMSVNRPTHNLSPWLGKMKGVVGRLAAIYHLFETPDPLQYAIHPLHMQYACNMVRDVLPHMQVVASMYAPDSTKASVHKTVNWLKRQQRSVQYFKVRDMYRELRLKSEEAHTACDYLWSCGILSLGFIPENKPGRPHSPVYCVNYFALEQMYPSYRY